MGAASFVKETAPWCEGSIISVRMMGIGPAAICGCQ